MTQKNNLRFGVIGAGRIGKIHAENLATRIPGVEVAAIADVDLKAAQEFAAHLHVPVALEDYHAILTDPTIVLAQSSNFHRSIAGALPVRVCLSRKANHMRPGSILAIYHAPREIQIGCRAPGFPPRYARHFFFKVKQNLIRSGRSEISKNKIISHTVRFLPQAA